LLFDENFGKPLVTGLAAFLAFYDPPPEIAHLLERFTSGESDDVWIPRIAADGWIVISSDRAKQAGGPKLPNICAAHSVSHVLVSGKLHNKNQFEKIRAITVAWPDIVRIPNRPRGTRFNLRCDAAGNPFLEDKSLL
jgi:hypothetical protein